MAGKAEDIYKRYFELMPVMIGTLGFDGLLKELNPSWERQLGLTLAEMAGRPYLDFIHPEDRALAAETQKKARDGQPEARFDARFICKDGTSKWLGTRLLADRERKLFYIVSGEIAARKEVETSLRDNQEDLRRFLEQAPVAVGIRNKAGDLKFINRKFKETFGYGEKEIFSFQDWCRLAYPDPAVNDAYRAQWKASLEAAGRSATGEIPPGEYRITCKDGSVKVVNLVGMITAEGDLAVMLEDVTGPAETLRALREGEATLRHILDQAPLPMAIHAMGGHIEYVNAKFTKTLGYRLEDIPDKEIWALKVAPDPAYRAEIMAKWSDALRNAAETGQEIEEQEFRFVCKDGSARLMRIFGVIAAGKVFAMFEDITERTAALEALRRSEATQRSILENAPMPMAILALDGSIEYVNRKIEETFGYRHSDVPDLGHWWPQAYPDEAYRNEVIPRWTAKVSEAVSRQGSVDGGEYQITCKDGSRKTCQIFAVAAAEKIIVMFSDITERAAAAQALKDNESALRQILEQVPVAIAIQNMDNTLDFVNRKFTECFGYASGELPTLEAWARLAYPDEAYRKKLTAWQAAQIEKGMATGGEMDPIEVDIVGKDGTTKLVRVTGVVTTDKKIVSLLEDITSRAQAAKNIRESETMLRRTLEQAPISIALHSLDGKMEFFNQKFGRSFGYRLDEIPTLEAWLKLACPDEGYRETLTVLWREWIEKSLKTGLEMDGKEIRLVCKNGSARTVFITGIVTPDKKVLVLLDDITARVEAENALRERESLYRALVETTQTGYVVLDGLGKVVDANREYVRLTGRPDLKDIMGRSVLEWSAPHSQNRARKAVEIALRDGRVSNFEVDYVDMAGNFTTIEINATVVNRDGVQQILGLCRDVSARSKTEAHLRESESLYRALIETTGTGYVVADSEFKVVDANAEYARLAGYSKVSEIIGRSILDWTAPEFMERNTSGLRKCFREGRLMNFEVDYQGKSGKITPVEGSVTIVSRNGVPHILSLCRDITQRRKDAAELKALNHDLEKRVQERTSELTKANIELSQEVAQRIEAENQREKLQQELLQSQKMEVVGRLAGGIAHDFNNILVAISGYAEFLMKTMPEGAPAKEDLAEIVRETERGALLTRQLTAIGRKQPIEPKILSLNELAEDSCRMFKRIIGSNMNLETRLDPKAENIKADQSQVSQVIMNLILNARDAMPEGGKLLVSTGNEEVTEALPATMRLAPRPGHYVTLSVSDTGTGMTPETAKHIFDPFFTTKGEGKGNGLGLSTVYGIVHQCRGGIDLTTTPGKGSTFKIYFPRTLEH